MRPRRRKAFGKAEIALSRRNRLGGFWAKYEVQRVAIASALG